MMRGLRALEHLAGRPGGLTQAELGRLLAVNRSTAYRLLATLEESGYVRRDQDSRYRLTLKVLRLADKSLGGLGLRHEAAPVLRRLSQETALSTHLAVPAGGEVIYVDGVAGPGLVTVNAGLGAAAPVHCTATGKALAAYLPAADARRMLGSSEPARYTERTVVDPDSVEREWERVRSLGYAVDDEEFEPGVRCLAAPVFDHQSQVIGVIGSSGTAARVSVGRLQVIAEMVAAAADELSTSVGCREPGALRRRSRSHAGAGQSDGGVARDG